MIQSNAAPAESQPRTLVLPFSELDRDSTGRAGGKAANLGELTRAGFPVPPGFCVTTDAYALAVGGIELEPILRALEATPPHETAHLEELAAQAREHILAAPVPAAVELAVVEAYRALDGESPLPVAVRSSATAEDLPTASFAGQQDTYLNVIGPDALLDAVRRCWASLWTGRAVAYRSSNGIPHRAVRLAVAVQQMVEAEVAGVAFTANPLTGRRQQAVVDASPGLGEAIVSGAVNPDRFVVDTASGKVVERNTGDKRIRIQSMPGGGTQRIVSPEAADGSGQPCLTDAEVRAVAQLGAQVEANYGTPQDIEWAFDAGGKLWLLQARPITTLYPLPDRAPDPARDLRVYFSVNVAQGVFRPFTPMGAQAFRYIASSMAALWGRPPRDPAAGPPVFVEAAQRLFIDITPVVRSMPGRRVLGYLLERAESRSASVLDELDADPRLAPRPASPWPVARAVASFFARTQMPVRLIRTVLFPGAARRAIARDEAAPLALGDVRPQATAPERLQAVERLLYQGGARVPIYAAVVIPVGLGAFGLAGRLLRDLATPAEQEIVLRGLPDNPTTEMDLELWALAARVRSDPAAARVLHERQPAQLAADYRAGVLPAPLQEGLAAFLGKYGHRAVAEIDLGLPRWAEDPAHILGALANYLQVDDPAMAPDLQFRRAVQDAEAMVAELTRRAARRSSLRGAVVAWSYRRVRLLLGQREAPKFYLVTMFAKARSLLQPVGEELARAGRLTTDEDIFFLSLPEARAAVAGTDQRALVRERRAAYEQELRRRHIPRILLSDGTEPGMGGSNAVVGGDALRGAPASVGVVTARARVILDPQGARLEPGEILVAPSTDPGWTPLFLTAGGLVMEMGGPMSHGAVVAREYGIPAVVGVPGATERIVTGQTITVDGGAGTVALTPVEEVIEE